MVSLIVSGIVCLKVLVAFLSPRVMYTPPPDVMKFEFEPGSCNVFRSSAGSWPSTAAPAHVFKNTHKLLAGRDIYPTDSTLIKNAIVGVNHQLSALFICAGGHKYHVLSCLTARHIAIHFFPSLMAAVPDNRVILICMRVMEEVIFV